MTHFASTKLIASSCGLCGFAVAIVAGLAAGNPTSLILSRALVSLFVCYLVGALIGAVAARAVEESIVDQQRAIAQRSEKATGAERDVAEIAEPVV